MKLLDKVARRFGYAPVAPKRTPVRSYDGAQSSRLTNDWISTYTSADTEIRTALRTLRARCRSLERDNDYVRRYLKLLENNVLGSAGIGLQMKITNPDGSFDRIPNNIIEEAWEDQGKPENFSVTGEHSRCEAERLILRSAARDGGALVRIINGFGNSRRYAIQLVEIDQLDHEYNAVLPNGNEIRMGVEFDKWRRPQAYHIFSAHPGDLIQRYSNGQRRERVPAGEMKQIYLPERIGQSVGVPWLVSAILRLKMLNGYEEAELIAAREAACKGYAIEKATPESYSGEQDERGNSLQDVEPGMGVQLDPGEKYVSIDPQHPTQAFPFFVKAELRGIASGLGVSYNSLANDLENVNYSSIRAGLLEEREEWKAVQRWFIERFYSWLFQDWLSFQLGMGLIQMPSGAPLPASRFDKFNKPEWKARRWPWVDPLKDMEANILAVEKGFNSRRRIISEQGEDVEDVFLEQSEDNALAKEYGLNFEVAPVKSPGPVQDAAGKTAA